jgi:hypothetical protein
MPKLEKLRGTPASKDLEPLRHHHATLRFTASDDAPYRPVAEFWAEYPAQQPAATSSYRRRRPAISAFPCRITVRSGNASVKSPPRRIVSPTIMNGTRADATSRCMFSEAMRFFIGTIYLTVT